MGEGAVAVLMSPPIGFLRFVRLKHTIRIYPIAVHVDFGFCRRLTRTVDRLAASSPAARRASPVPTRSPKVACVSCSSS